MEIFAHNGIDHAGAAEAAAHSLPQIIMIVLLVTVSVVILMAGLTYLAKRFGAVPIPIEEEKEE